MRVLIQKGSILPKFGPYLYFSDTQKNPIRLLKAATFLIPMRRCRPYLLQGCGLATNCGTGCIARQPALASLKKLPGPAVIHRGGDTVSAAQHRDVRFSLNRYRIGHRSR